MVLSASGKVPFTIVPTLRARQGIDQANSVGQDKNLQYEENEKSKVQNSIYDLQMAINRGHLSRTRFSGVAATTVNTTAAETTMIGAGKGNLTLPTNFFKVGKSLVVSASGVYSTKAAATGTITINFKLGSTAILTTGAVTPVASAVNYMWSFDGILTCQSIGSSGTVFGQGKVMHIDDATPTYDLFAWPMTNTAATTINTTTQQVMDLTVTWSTSDISNSIVCSNFIVRIQE